MRTKLFLKKVNNFLLKLPVSVFSAVMGFAGLSRAFMLAETLFKLNHNWAVISGTFAVALFLVLIGLFLIKLFLLPDQIKSEFNNPLEGSFYGTVSISVLLISTIIQPYSNLGYQIIWSIGLLMMFSLAYFTIYRLLSIKRHQSTFGPSMILPAVGILNVAVTGNKMNTDWAHEINIFSFSVGAVLTIVFFTLIFARIMHQDKLNQYTEPSMMILMSPFGVGFMAYHSISGKTDLFAVTLYYFGLFLFGILCCRIFLQQKSFVLSWWSVGFPLAALTNASAKYAIDFPYEPSNLIAAGLLVILACTIFLLSIKSIEQLFKGNLFSAPSSKKILQEGTTTERLVILEN